MTTVTLTARGNDITGFSVEGHSGYAETGSDIVCAAVSAAVQLVECQLTDQLGIQLDEKIDESGAVIQIKIKNDSDIEKAQPPMQALATVMRSWVTQYPKNIKIQEVSLKC